MLRDNSRRFFRLLFALCTNFTKFTSWCYKMVYWSHEASHNDSAR